MHVTTIKIGIKNHLNNYFNKLKKPSYNQT